MKRRDAVSVVLVAVCATVAAWLPAAPAQAWEAGGHLGLNLDQGDIHIGADLVFPLTDVSPHVRLSLWPSFAHVFRDHAHDVELFGLDFPFEFLIDNSVVTPFVAPGLGLAIYEDVSLKLNVIGGVFVNTNGPVRPFAELALRFINGTFVDLLVGILFAV
jgi:hypothetical protein